MTLTPPGIDTAAVDAQHARLLALAQRISHEDIPAVLALGAAVVLHGLLEPAHLGSILALADPVAAKEMRTDHRCLADDLAFLDELATSDPGSPDLMVLSRAILDRLRSHLERDQRALYAPLARLREVSVAKS